MDHLIYVRSEGAEEPKFDVEVDDEQSNNYSVHGWLPVVLEKRAGQKGHVVRKVDDNWLTRPKNEPCRPRPGPVRPISAAECVEELRARQQ